MGGGCCILARRILNIREIDLALYAFESVFEVCGVETTLNNKKVTIVKVYRAPSTLFTQFINKLDIFLDFLVPVSDVLFITGDFNIDLSTTSNEQRVFTNVMSSFGLYPTVTEFTRVTVSSKSLIDNIFTNVAQDVFTTVGDSYISDHRYISMWLGTERIGGGSRIPSSWRRSFSIKGKKAFEEALEKESWEVVYEINDFNDKFTAFTDMLGSHYGTAFPLKIFKSDSKNEEPWITQ